MTKSTKVHLRATRQRGEKERRSKGENSKEKLYVQNRTRKRERWRKSDAVICVSALGVRSMRP